MIACKNLSVKIHITKWLLFKSCSKNKFFCLIAGGFVYAAPLPALILYACNQILLSVALAQCALDV